MSIDLSAFEITAVLATYVFAATAKGVTGLGFSTTCLPILTLFIGLKDALPLVILPSVVSNLVVMHQVGRFGETLRRFWPMLLSLLPGLALGLWILSQIDGAKAGAILGAILLAWCLFSVAKPDLRLPEGSEQRLGPISGFITGIINGVTGSQVMPNVPFLMMLNLERTLFIQAINCSFTLSSLVMMLGLAHLGLLVWADLALSALGVGFVLVGLRIGGAIRQRLSETLFRNAVLAMLFAMGFSLILPAL